MDRSYLVLAAALVFAALAVFALLRGDEPIRGAPGGEPIREAPQASAPEPAAPAPAPQARGLDVAGRVTNPRGEGVPGVRIAVRGARADASAADATGAYMLRLEPRAGEVPTLRFSASGYQDALVELEPEGPAAGSVRLDVRLEPLPGAVVEGTLRDERGAPIAGETIDLASSERKARFAGVSGADGRFFIPGVQAGPGYYLSIHPKGGYGDYQRAVEVGPEGLSLEIFLRALSAARVKGRLVDVGGDPIPGLELSVVSSQALGRTLATVTDADGYFELAEVPTGHLTFTAGGTDPFALGGVLVRPDADSELLLRADWGEQVLRGRVVDAGGRPLGGAEVELSWSHVGEGSGGRSLRSAVTDAGGSFEFRRLGGGIHRVEVRAAGHREVQLDYEVGAQSPGLEVQLEPVEPG